MPEEPTAAAARLRRVLGFLELDSANLRLLGEAVDLSLQLERFDEARALCARGLAASGNAAPFRYRLSCIARGTGDWQQAMEISRSLLQENANDPAIRYNFGVALMMLGRHAEAKEQLKALDAHAAQFPQLPYYLGRTLHHLGELDAAARIVRAHLASHPGDALTAGMYSTLCMDRDEYAEAGKWSAVALQSRPADVDALLTRALLALGEQREDEAEIAFERVLELQPRNARAWVGRAMTHLLRQDIAAARADFARTLELMPEHLGTWQALGWCQILEQNLAGAEASFNEAKRLDRNFSESHGGLATIAALQGRWDEAERSAGAALRLDPRSFAGRFAQGLVLQHAGRGAQAQQSMRQLLDAPVLPDGSTLLQMIQRHAKRIAPRASPV